MKQNWKQPSHPDLLEVVEQPGKYSSFSRSKASHAPGALIVRLESPTLTPAATSYSTVQVSRSTSIELNSDFLFINHACQPSLEFHVVSSPDIEDHTSPPTGSSGQREQRAILEIRAAARPDGNGNVIGLREGDEMTFFYPSTEWDMAQPFQCHCNASLCKGTIKGAKYMDRKDLQGYFLNQHILDLLESRDRTAN